MDITFYMHYFDAKKVYSKKIKEVGDFEKDFVSIVNWILAQDEESRTKDFSKDKIAMYLNQVEYDEEENLLLLEFKSARYSKIRKVVNTINWKEKKDKKKGRHDGDEESTSIGLKFYGEKEAYCMFERNSDGIGLPKIKDYLNEQVKKYHKEVLQDNVLYRIETNNMISEDFLYALSHADRIKAVRLIIDQENLVVSENKKFADRADLNSDVEIVLKPSEKGKSIHHNTVKDFYKIYSDPKKIIKKIYVDSDEADGNPLKFDTEKMKAKHIIDILEMYNGEADLESLNSAMRKVLSKYN